MNEVVLDKSLDRVLNSPGILKKFPEIESIKVKSEITDGVYEFDLYIKLNKDFDSKFELSFEPRSFVSNYLIDILSAMNINKRDILQIYTSVIDKSGKIVY